MNLILIAVLLIIAYFLVRPIIRGAAFFPTNPESVQAMIQLAEVKDGERIADLGSGDGRILIAFAQRGFEAHGYEINPILVWWSRWRLRRAGIANIAFVHQKSFWKTDLSSYNIVAVYGIPYIMKQLGKKLGRELKPGARILSYIYPIPDWQADSKKSGIYLYRLRVK